MKELKIASVQDQYHELEAPFPVARGPLPVGIVLPAAEAKHALSVSGI